MNDKNKHSSDLRIYNGGFRVGAGRKSGPETKLINFRVNAELRKEIKQKYPKSLSPLFKTFLSYLVKYNVTPEGLLKKLEARTPGRKRKVKIENIDSEINTIPTT